MIIDELFEAPQQCPECGGISFSDLILAEKKDACYYKVKASAKVWPSAYASGRLVQCRKKGAANYGNKSEGVAEGLNEFAPDGLNGDDDDEGFSPEIAKMAQEDGFTKGVSLADGATLERAMKINYWHTQHDGMYKQYFAKGFKAGRMNKVKHDNKQYNLNLKLMKDGSIRHGEQGVAEANLSELNKDTVYSYAKKADKDQDKQSTITGKAYLDNDPKTANKAHHKFSMRAAGLDRAEKRLNKEGVAEGSRTPQDWEVKSAVWGLDKRGVHQEPQDVKSHFVRADRSSRAEKKAKREYEPGRQTWEIHPRGNKQQGVAEGSDQQWVVTVGTKTGGTSHTMTFSGTKEQAIKQAVARFGTSKNPVVTAKPKQQGVAEGVTPASTSKVLRLIDRHNPEWFEDYGMGEVEDTVVELAERGEFQGMSAVDAMALVHQELEKYYGHDREQGMAEQQELDEKWSQKYKSSINCANPKGFSQRAHCAGRNKNEDVAEGALDDSNFGKSAALMTPSPQAAQQAKDIVQKQADANVISQAKIAGAAPVTREGEQQKGADYRDPKEVDYDDEYDAMVARVKRLAGLGPLKTVYDPTKRQYRNMPTAVQPKK